MPQAKPLGSDGQGPSEDMISKVGAAVGHVAAIQESYTPRIAAAASDSEKHDLQKEATKAALHAISDEGLTVEEYNQVITAAQADPDLEERLLEAANAA
jgi:hypothetical protein